MDIRELVRLYGLPPGLPEILGRSGIQRLYPPQLEAIRAGAITGKSLVLAAPTASGKTLVAELAMLHAVHIRGGRALYLVPLRALAWEKYEDFREKYEPLGIEVGVATGDFDRPDRRLASYPILVLTNEKADSLLRHRTGWLLEGLKLVVVDEIHLLGDPGRGPTLEVVLAALRRALPELQVLALSATISNPEELARWLGAEALVSDFRPIPLRKGVYLEGRIFYASGEVREVGGEGDPLEQLVLDTVRTGGQALIFVSTRRSTQAVAKRLSRPLGRELSLEERSRLEGLAARMVGAGEEPTSLGKELSRCVRNGVAFHHAGLHHLQRRAVEDAFRERLLKALCTTTTLAAGVNLPARRVIIRDVRRYGAGGGAAYIPTLEYHQMAGRAGRPGLDPFGEAILIAKDEEGMRELLERFVFAPPERIVSALGSSGMLAAHVLGAVAAGYAGSPEGLLEFFGLTLFAQQQGMGELAFALRLELEFLLREGFLVESRGRLKTTPLGELVAKLYIHPVSAVVLREGLSRVREIGSRPLTLLHLLARTPDMELLAPRRAETELLEEVAQGYRGLWLVDVPRPGERGYRGFLAELKTALVLYRWIEEDTEDELYDNFGVGPGDIHRLVEAGEWLLYAAGALARLLRLPQGDLERLRERVRHGVREELLELVRLRGIGRIRARVLYGAGYRSLRDLAAASEEEIARLPHFGPALARSIKEELRRFLP